LADGLSKTQIDKLGERLKGDQPSELDLQALDEYRRSFREAYDTVVGSIRDRLGLDPSGRRAKTVPSLREKLRRESIRLTQVQDIAGCRLVVPYIADQDRVVSELQGLFPSARVIDRCVIPSYGYRAVHIVPEIDAKCVEIQVRTSMQHAWAELSERWSDIDPGIKYGGGDPHVKAILLELSDFLHARDKASERLRRLCEQSTPSTEVDSQNRALGAMKDELKRWLAGASVAEQQLVEFFDRFLRVVEARIHDLPH
jgi:putative GTP pyrophosphokinase